VITKQNLADKKKETNVSQMAENECTSLEGPRRRVHVIAKGDDRLPVAFEAGKNNSRARAKKGNGKDTRHLTQRRKK
jgi:hypothetical protein